MNMRPQDRATRRHDPSRLGRISSTGDIMIAEIKMTLAVLFALFLVAALCPRDASSAESRSRDGTRAHPEKTVKGAGHSLMILRLAASQSAGRISAQHHKWLPGKVLDHCSGQRDRTHPNRQVKKIGHLCPVLGAHEYRVPAAGCRLLPAGTTREAIGGGQIICARESKPPVRDRPPHSS